MKGIIPVVMRPEWLSLSSFIDYLDISNGVMVEIGSYAGESAEAFAKSGKFKEIYCVDPWIDDYDMSLPLCQLCSFKAVEEEFDNRTIPYKCIYKCKGFSNEIVKQFTDSFFDLVYVDGDHSYGHVIEDITLWLPKLKKNGYMSGHDYGTKDGVYLGVNSIFGKPDVVFSDYSWIKKI
jgi:hypothetical protein